MTTLTRWGKWGCRAKRWTLSGLESGLVVEEEEELGDIPGRGGLLLFVVGPWSQAWFVWVGGGVECFFG